MIRNAFNSTEPADDHQLQNFIRRYSMQILACLDVFTTMDALGTTAVPAACQAEILVGHNMYGLLLRGAPHALLATAAADAAWPAAAAAAAAAPPPHPPVPNCKTECARPLVWYSGDFCWHYAAWLASEAFLS